MHPFGEKEIRVLPLLALLSRGVVKAAIPVEIDLDYCKGCGICAEECPAKAIQMVREDQSDE